MSIRPQGEASGIERSSHPELTFTAPARERARAETVRHDPASPIQNLKSKIQNSERDIQDVLEWLAVAHDWLTAEDLCKLLHIPVNEASKRKIRRAAETSLDRIGSGNEGYKLVERMTVEEWLAFKHRMLNQGIAMIRRIKKAAHHRKTPQLELVTPDVRRGPSENPQA